MQPVTHLGSGWLFLLIYFAGTTTIGLLSSRHNKTSGDYLNATHALPLPVVVLAYLASNCGALETVGLSAMAAQYGAVAFHFYLIGAIPAMVFLALWMMPLYRRNGIRSVPEYLLLRYGPRMRLLNACVTACMLLLLSGVSLYAMAQVLILTLGLTFEWGLLACAVVVLGYVLAGGIRATIHNEVFQLAVMVAGLLPLAVRSARLARTVPDAAAQGKLHLWQGMPLLAPHARMDVFGVVVGLGFVLGFGYWCTDFVMMQRAFSARTETDARQVPLWAGFGKMLFSLLVVIPGLCVLRILPASGEPYDRALPRLMTMLYQPWLLGLGLTALAASLMSSLASNLSAFAALWTEDIYRTTLVRDRSDGHYLRMGRAAVVAAMLFSLLASYLNFLFKNLMEHIQLIFSVFGAPFWAVFLMGMFHKKVNERGAMLGFLAGSGCSFLHSLLVARGVLHYGSVMTANFYAAAYAFAIAALCSWLLSTPATGKGEPKGLLQWRGGRAVPKTSAALWVLSGLLLACAVGFDLIWR